MNSGLAPLLGGKESGQFGEELGTFAEFQWNFFLEFLHLKGLGHSGKEPVLVLI